MNLSKKSIKHILRILDNKCVENPSKTTTISFGGNQIPTREFTPKNKEVYGWWSIVYVPSEGYFWGIKNEMSEEFGMDLDIPDIWSPAQLADL